jgi:hypothetical protein
VLANSFTYRSLKWRVASSCGGGAFVWLERLEVCELIDFGRQAVQTVGTELEPSEVCELTNFGRQAAQPVGPQVERLEACELADFGR